MAAMWIDKVGFGRHQVTKAAGTYKPPKKCLVHNCNKTSDSWCDDFILVETSVIGSSPLRTILNDLKPQ